MRIQLVDSSNRDHLLPLTFTRPVSELRCGILTIAEKYTRRGHAVGNETQSYLQRKYPSLAKADLAVDGGVCPTDEFLAAAEALRLWGRAYARAIPLLHGKVKSLQIPQAVCVLKDL